MVRHSSVHQEIIGRKFDLLQTVRTSLSPDPPWDSIIDFACHPYFCGQRLYPKQRTFLKLAHLETENMTSFDIDTIEEWREGFLNHQEVAGVQPDVWERVGWLKERGYRHFSEILSIIGRRGSKGVVGGILGAEKIAYFYWLDNWQQHFGLKPHSDGYLSVIATTFEQAKKFQFNDIKLVVEGCRYLQPAISTDKEHYLSIRTPTDEAYIAELLARGVPVEREIASIKAQAFSANSASSRGGAMFCLDPTTPVLTSDLKWVPIGDLQIGDEVVGLDEEPPTNTDSTKNSGKRKIRTSTVLGVWRNRQKAYKIHFDDGTSVTCSGNHRWLYRYTTGNYVWKSIEDSNRRKSTLKVGDQIASLTGVWEEDNTFEGGYLSGIFDGEGHILGANLGYPLSVSFTQNKGLVLDQVLSMLEKRGYTPRYQGSEDDFCQVWALYGSQALKLLGSVRPVRLLNKAQSCYDGIALMGRGCREQPDSFYRTIVRIEELPVQELVDIETSTKTFIANGLVSHNSSFYDEFAHQITGTGSNKTGEEIYNAGQPSLKQFKKSAFTYIPSTPFSQIGKLFELYNVGTNLMPYGDEVKASQEAIELGEEPIFTEEEKGRPVAEVYQEKTLVVDPSKLIIQLPSWGLYEGYDKSTKIPLFSKAYFEKSKRWTKNKGNYIKEAVTSYDEQMMITERANPEAFRVEHRAQFAPVEGAYLSVAKIKQMFEAPGWRPLLSQQSHGIPLYRYRIHCDPGRTGANFALAIGHVETAPPDEHGHVWEHVVIDVLRVWRPMDYADGIVDYVQVQQEIRQILLDFPSTFKLSMDQWNSASLLAHLQKEFSPRIRITEDTFTESVNQNRFEDFKTILNLGWIHSYRDSLYKDNTNCLLELELKFLQEKNGKVVKQEVGPVTTKDLCDAVMTVACDLLRDNLIRFADLTGSAYGSSNFRGIESGTELERQNALGLGSTQNATSKARSRLHENQLDRARGRARDISRGYSRSRGR